jgi:hypothetical protein
MKKIIASVFLLSSVCVSNAAMRPEDALNHPKKIKSEIPSHRFSSAVPPRQDDLAAYLAAQHLRCNASSDIRSPRLSLSDSQELRRCP